ncbi:MAG: hypothetical protein M1829_005396 [Trizodia sp. TS-e1964]|nr:MAG: hypothetical protein M1829_005396 [Trizodia sp. TS-e1964]
MRNQSRPGLSHSLTSTALLVLVLALSSNAQNLLVPAGTVTLPACSTACNPLYQAQYACVPPAAPASGPEIYTTCFCQSNFLIPLKAGAAGLCDTACSTADLALIHNWYNAKCGAGAATTTIPGVGVTTTVVVDAPGAATTSPATTTAGTTSTASTTLNAALPGSTTTSSSSSASNTDPPQTWIQSHYQWVIMLVVIFVGLALISVAGVYFRRRYHRKRDAALGPTLPSTMAAGALGTRPASVAAPAQSAQMHWGPHQHQNHTQGYLYAEGYGGAGAGTGSGAGAGSIRSEKEAEAGPTPLRAVRPARPPRPY